MKPLVFVGCVVLLAVGATRREDATLEAERLVRAYVAAHRLSTEEMVAAVKAAPCSRRFLSADFWGRGLGNSVNTPLNALGLAVASNRTLLLSVDKQYEAGFWRYLGEVPWPREDRVLEAFRQARGCERCGGCGNGPLVKKNFFPMNARCLREGKCGDGVDWLLCNKALTHQDAPFVHISGAVTWLAPLFMKSALFESGANSWGLLFDALVNAKASPLQPVLERKLKEGVYDLGIHVRHRQFQDVDAIQGHAANCVRHALKTSPRGKRKRVFIATELPSRIPSLMEAIQKASPLVALDFDFLNASEVPERESLRAVARTNARAVRRDWGEHALERWLSVADFYLLSSAKLIVGTLASTFSELAIAANNLDSEGFLFDPIFHITDPKERSQPQKRKWPSDDEYLSDYGPHFSCIPAHDDWPLPQYLKIRPDHLRGWLRQGGCSI